MSSIGWIDFSPSDRDKVNTALAMLTEPGTLDELGIGRIRDGYADLLFPGISTIQTRAKYFITVPRLLRDYCLLPVKNKKAYKGIKPYMKKYENDVAVRLLKVHGDDQSGIIGRNRVGSGGVDRAPSVIYWNGLREFEIIKTKSSFNDFCRQLEAHDFESDKLHQHDDEEKRSVSNGLIDTSAYDKEWLESEAFSLKLTQSEAEFLREKVIGAAKIEHSVLVQLLLDLPLARKAISITDRSGDSQYSSLTELLSLSENINQKTIALVNLANNFSVAMEGPHIAFNIVYAMAAGAYIEEEKYRQQYQAWLNKVMDKRLFKAGCAEDWLIGAELNGNAGRVGIFINQISELVRAGGDVSQMMQCVQKRALDNKGRRSILASKRHVSVDDNLNWVGMRQLDYRWNTAKVILDDILGGLDARP